MNMQDIAMYVTDKIFLQMQMRTSGQTVYTAVLAKDIIWFHLTDVLLGVSSGHSLVFYMIFNSK